jgi:hypothetical protein
MEPLVQPTTFIVRVSRPADGPLTGTVERARTGEKQRFEGLEAVGALIGQMLASTARQPSDGPPREESVAPSPKKAGPLGHKPSPATEPEEEV